MAKIKLRIIEDKDLPLFKEWLKMPHVAPWYSEPHNWIKEVEQRDKEFAFLHHFIAEANGQPIGFCLY